MVPAKALQVVSILGLIVPSLISCKQRKSVADRIVMVQEGDHEMEIAGKAALAELPLFWERFSHPKTGDACFSVKVTITDSNGNEYFWLTDIQRSGKSISGIVDQEPQLVKNIRLNQRVEVTLDKVIDWMFLSNGKMKGNFTLRPLMKNMPKDDLQNLLPLLDQNPSIKPSA